MPRAWLGPLYMLVSCLFFSVMSLCVAEANLADPSLGPGVASFVRALINGLVLLLMTGGDWRGLFGDARPALWVRGIAGTAALLTFFAAVPIIGLGEATFLNQSSAFWVAVLAPWVLKERTSPWVWAAVGLALLGLALLLEPGGGSLTGRVLGGVSGVGAAMAYLAIRSTKGGVRTVTTVWWFAFVGAVVSGVLSIWEPWPAWGPVWAYLLGAGLFATLGQLTMTRAYEIAPAAPVAATGAASPLFAALWGWLFLSQEPSARGMLGMGALALAAVVLPFLGAARSPAPLTPLGPKA